jgi:two-component system sensor histidine kinase CpxA
MLADISHELRSPLTRIAVSLELLRRGELDVIEPMQADLDRLNQMIGQILELSRFELEGAESSLGPVDLNLLIEDIVELANHEGRSLRKSATFSATVPCLVFAEESSLRSCIENIVRNALQYSPGGGQIGVNLVCGEKVVLCIDDEGPGVPEAALGRLFDPFFRTQFSIAAQPHGTGLGLSISARIAARYGGTIVASNRVPHGLSVCLSLPRCAPDAL